MNVLVIDGQGGKIGRELIEALRAESPGVHITAVGTNGVATASMLKAGADEAATGENAVKVCAKNADVIAGPIAIVIADSLLGEITPEMAVAVGAANAVRVLVPLNQCKNLVAGAGNGSLQEMIADAVRKIVRHCS